MDRFALIEKFAGKMSQERREDLPSKAFAVPESKAKKIGVSGEIKGEAKGKYPIPDMKHARNALARVSQHGTPAEREAVRKKVYSKFPGLKEGFEESHGGESPTSKENIKKVEQGGIGKVAVLPTPIPGMGAVKGGTLKPGKKKEKKGKATRAEVKLAAMADELAKLAAAQRLPDILREITEETAKRGVKPGSRSELVGRAASLGRKALPVALTAGLGGLLYMRHRARKKAQQA